MRNPIEKENAFKAWLENHFGNSKNKNRVVSDAIARCRRINDELGDLAVAYRDDRCANFLRLLTYTADDARNGVQPPAGLAFKKKPADPLYFESVKKGLASLRSALKLYLDFRADEGLSAANLEGGPKGAGPNRPMSIESKFMVVDATEFSGILKRYHDWLIGAEEMSKNSADQYKTYVKKLASATGAILGKGWFESLVIDCLRLRSSEKLMQCSALIDNMIRNAQADKRKFWRNWRCAFHSFESFLYDITDTYAVDQEMDCKRPETNTAVAEPKRISKNQVSGSTIATYPHAELIRTFLGRLKTQGRYYPSHKLLFPTRTVTKIFHGQRPNAWINWLKDDLENMRVWVSEHKSVLFSEVKELTIRGDGAVFATLANRSQCEVWTKTANGKMKRQCALRGVRDLSIDHVVPLEKIIGKKKLVLAGLRKLSDMFREYTQEQDGKFDERREFSWVKDFFQQFGPSLQTEEMRTLIKQDLLKLDLQYELMDAKENTIKSNKQ